MRDTRASEEYFRSKIEDKNRQVQREPERLARVPADRSNHVFLGTWKSQFQVLLCRYNLGDPVGDILGELPGLVSRAAELDEFSIAVLGNGVRRHFEMFETLCSWAVLLGDDGVKATLASVYERDAGRDFLLASFLGLDDVPEFLYVESLRVELKQAAVLALEGRGDEAAAVLTKFVKSQWYNRNQGSAWHGTHRELLAYYGYWCWEAAAVAKVFGIDDSALEGNKYYPWDLAHSELS